MKLRTKHAQPRRTRTFRCRCRSCEARVTLDLRPDAYRRRYACASCGRSSEYRDEVLRIDWYRTSRAESKRRGVCHCSELPFPHRPGSSFLKNARCAAHLHNVQPHRRGRESRVAA